MPAHPLPAPPVRPDGLQLDEHRALQRRVWRIQRAGWAVFALICLAALLGLTGGGGPLHAARLHLGPVEIELPRISRWQAPDELRLRVLEDDGPHRLVLDQAFLDRFEVERIDPRPETMRAAPRGQVMDFLALGPPPHEITLHLRAERAGLAAFDLEIDGQRARLHSLVLP